MASLPKPLIALLVATVAVAALWVAVLKKTVTGGNSTGSQTPATYQSAIAKAHQAVATSDSASVAHGGTVVQSPPAPTATTSPAAKPVAPTLTAATQTAATHTAATHTAATHTAATAAVPARRTKVADKAAAKTLRAFKHPAVSVNAVLKAIAQHKVVALLFFNPSAADDVAVKQELAGVSIGGRQVAKFAVPVTQLAQFNAVTNRVPVTTSPTLLVIDKHGETTSAVGFVDQLAITQQVAGALSSH